jgi:hypothetical protein
VILPRGLLTAPERGQIGQFGTRPGHQIDMLALLAKTATTMA